MESRSVKKSVVAAVAADAVAAAAGIAAAKVAAAAAAWRLCVRVKYGVGECIASWTKAAA
jgi:hypothetical protein